MSIKRNLFLVIILYLLTACTTVNKINLLPIKILGYWGYKEELISGGTPYEIYNRVFFFPFNMLMVNTQTNGGRVYYDLYTYKFVEEDKVVVNGRLFDVLKIKQDRNSLIINSTHGFPPDGKYTKILSFWLCLLLFIIAILIFTSLYKYRNKFRIS